MLIKLFLNTTDKFLCSSVRNVFSKAENGYKQKDVKVDLMKELKSFEENPLGCMIGLNSKFEANIKVKIKMILGLFFVLVPVIGFSAVAYALNLPQESAFIATFLVAILVASRMDVISRRYVQTRSLEFTQ